MSQVGRFTMRIGCRDYVEDQDGFPKRVPDALGCRAHDVKVLDSLEKVECPSVSVYKLRRRRHDPQETRPNSLMPRSSATDRTSRTNAG